MIVISSALALADTADGLTLDHPIIGWHNVVTPATIMPDVEAAGFPGSNMANPATHLEWRSSTSDGQYILIQTNEVDEIDYIAVAKHNWGTAEITVSVEGWNTGDGPWTELVQGVMLADDSPALFRFVAGSWEYIRFALVAPSAIPRAAVIYVGKLLVLERKIYVGHVPLSRARKTDVINNMSQSGNSLGAIELGAWRESTIPLSLISPDWYREYMDPFLADVGKRKPWFFAHRPQSYPFEVGYCKLIDDPMPVPTGPSNLEAFDMKVIGVA